MSTSYGLGDLAARVGGQVVGDPERRIRGVATLAAAGPDELSFLINPRYRAEAASTGAGAVLVGLDTRIEGRDLLQVSQPYAALASLLELFHPVSPPRPGVSPDARVGHDVRLGPEVHIGPFAVVGDRVDIGARAVIGSACVLGDGCRIGEAAELRPGVVLYAGTWVGARVLVHSGVVLGGDGFGFATVGGEHRKVPQVGRVVVEDDVEIGANSAVDRAMLGETRIGRGSKIDDLVMIGHGVQLGPGALLAGQVGLAGSGRIGARARLAGQSGVAGHLDLGDDVTVAAKSAVFEDLPDGAFVAGVPAIDHRRWKRFQVLAPRLPELRRELRELERRLAAVERRLSEEPQR